MCLACIEPMQTYQELDYAKYTVLGHLLSAMHKHSKEELARREAGEESISERKIQCQRC